VVAKIRLRPRTVNPAGFLTLEFWTVCQSFPKIKMVLYNGLLIKYLRTLNIDFPVDLDDKRGSDTTK
jgi:hypothetical protein